MYCTKCGKKNADDRLFCGFCGSPLDAPEQAPSPEDAERKLYGRPEPAPSVGESAPAVREMEAGAEKAAGPEAQSEASLSRRARRERQAEAAAREAAAREGDEWPELDIEPPIAPRTHARPAPVERTRTHSAEPPRPEADEEGFCAGALDEEYGEAADIPPEEDAPDEAEDPLARPLLREPVELRAKHPPRLSRQSAPVKPHAAAGARRVNTVVPPRTPDPDDLFLEDEADAEDDIADFVDEYLNDYRYEERPGGNFFVRHIRGFVTLILLLVFALGIYFWLAFGSGQRLMGQLYISGNPATYVELGKEAEAAGDYAEAGDYFLKALEVHGAELDSSDRDTAVNAANAYIRAENAGRAAEALEYLIAIDPNDPAPYNTLKQLYPDAASRPQRVTQLLQQGAQNTGDASLAQ